MNAYEAAVRTAKRDLEKLGVRWALVGGAAVSARGAPRFTQDIDVAIAVLDDQEAEQIVGQLRSLGYALETLLADMESGAIATIAFDALPRAERRFCSIC